MSRDAQPSSEPPALGAIREAVAGLMYPSESDAPFDMFVGKPDDAPFGSARDFVVTCAKPGAKFEEVPLDRFFADLESSEDAERFRNLRRILEANLQSLSIVRAGTGPRVDVYLLGRLASGEWVGLHTISVET